MELATGTVVKSHGVRGDLVVDVRTDSPEERFAVGTTITLRHTSGVTSHHEVRPLVGIRDVYLFIWQISMIALLRTTSDMLNLLLTRQTSLMLIIRRRMNTMSRHLLDSML